MLYRLWYFIHVYQADAHLIELPRPAPGYAKKKKIQDKGSAWFCKRQLQDKDSAWFAKYNFKIRTVPGFARDIFKIRTVSGFAKRNTT